MKKAAATLDDIRIHVRLKISALWASVMFCYVYGDYFWLYAPGKLQQMLEGRMPPFGEATQGVLLGTSIMMAIPSAMIFLSLALKPDVSRWANIVLGVIYSVIVLLTMLDAWAFYLFWGTADIILTTLIVWYAWRWPRQPPATMR